MHDAPAGRRIVRPHTVWLGCLHACFTGPQRRWSVVVYASLLAVCVDVLSVGLYWLVAGAVAFCFSVCLSVNWGHAHGPLSKAQCSLA
jgi:hypothetical protein